VQQASVERGQFLGSATPNCHGGRNGARIRFPLTRPATAQEAWEWLVANAYWGGSHEDRVRGIYKNDQEVGSVLVRRGDVAASLVEIARALRWKGREVSRLLVGLVEQHAIKARAGFEGTLLISVANYDRIVEELFPGRPEPFDFPFFLSPDYGAVCQHISVMARDSARRICDRLYGKKPMVIAITAGTSSARTGTSITACLSRGGSDMLHNLWPACRSCNAAKGVLTAHGYRQRLTRREVRS
jgi:hypothetical protein